MEKVDEEVNFLLRSDARRQALVALDEEGPLERYEIEENIDASRRTVSRILKTLVDEEYIQQHGDSYRLTAYGGSMIGLYRSWKEQAALTERYRPFLAHVDDELFGCDLRLLRGAELTVATDTEPYAPVNRHLAVREDATRIRAVTPVIEKQCPRQTTKRLRNGEEFEIEVIFPQEVLNRPRPAWGDDVAIERIRTSDDISHFVYPRPVEMGITIVDDTVLLGAYERRELHALLESTNPELREWASEQIDAYRRDAVPSEEYRQSAVSD